MADRFRCTQCRTENEREFEYHEQKRGLHRQKTITTYCKSCQRDTVQNKLGA